MINLDDVEDGIKELERAARLGLSGAMITEYPLEHRRYDQPEYEPFWAAAAALDLPLSLHTATRRQDRIRGAGDKTLGATDNGSVGPDDRLAGHNSAASRTNSRRANDNRVCRATSDLSRPPAVIVTTAASGSAVRKMAWQLARAHSASLVQP